jgi:hypothetical protein
VAGKYFIKIACWMAAASIGWMAPAVGADQTINITYLRGDAFVGTTADGPWERVKVGVEVAAGHFVKTSPNGYLELTLPDGSIVRLAPQTLFEIEAVEFPAKQPRRFSARLFLGKMWAKVARVLGRSTGSFRTRTATAVAGVRGTVYDLHATADRSTDIWVYDGRVAVGPPRVEAAAAREEMEWPRQVSESEWEEIILGKLQRLHIGPDGQPGKPLRFDPEKEKDAWTAWNMERDKAAD